MVVHRLFPPSSSPSFLHAASSFKSKAGQLWKTDIESGKDEGGGEPWSVNLGMCGRRRTKKLLLELTGKTGLLG